MMFAVVMPPRSRHADSRVRRPNGIKRAQHGLKRTGHFVFVGVGAQGRLSGDPDVRMCIDDAGDDHFAGNIHNCSARGNGHLAFRAHGFDLAVFKNDEAVLQGWLGDGIDRRAAEDQRPALTEN
jgi:hypothetical protein